MEQILTEISSNAFRFIGFAVMTGVLIVGGSILVEWGRALSKKWTKERRDEENGFEERREPDHHLERAITELVESMRKREDQTVEFMAVWKQAHMDLVENINAVSRVQKTNWKILFDEALPFIHHAIKESKHG